MLLLFYHSLYKGNKMKQKIANTNGINVLSLFDGISGGQIALERAGIKVANYFSSEIDQYAQAIVARNYPKILFFISAI